MVPESTQNAFAAFVDESYLFCFLKVHQIVILIIGYSFPMEPFSEQMRFSVLYSFISSYSCVCTGCAHV